MILATHGIVASQIVTVPVATAATGIGETSFTANWNAYTGADYYLLDVSLSSSFSTFVLENQFVLTNSYAVTGLSSNTTYYYRVRAVTDADTDVMAFVNRVYTATGSLSYTEVTAIETLVSDLKDYGIWTKMQAVYPMVGASAAACAQNLKSSSFTGTFSSGWTFASTGATPNGTGAYMDTGMNANTSLNINSSHISYYRNTVNSTGLGVLIGINDLSVFLQPIATNFYGSLGTTSILDKAGSYNITGFFMVNRPSSTIQKLIRNNTIELSDSQTSSSYASAQNIFIGNYNTASTFATNSRCALATIGDGLTDDEAYDFYNAVQAFNTTLSRNV